MTNRMKELEIKDRFDFVVCSHFLWQVRDLEKHLKRKSLSSTYRERVCIKRNVRQW